MVNRPIAGPIPTPGPAPTSSPIAAESEAPTEPAISRPPTTDLRLFDDDSYRAGLAPVVVPPSIPPAAAPPGVVDRLLAGLADRTSPTVPGDGVITPSGVVQTALLAAAVVLAVGALVFSLARMGEQDSLDPVATTLSTPIWTSSTTLPTLAPDG